MLPFFFNNVPVSLFVILKSLHQLPLGISRRGIHLKCSSISLMTQAMPLRSTFQRSRLTITVCRHQEDILPRRHLDLSSFAERNPSSNSKHLYTPLPPTLLLSHSPAQQEAVTSIYHQVPEGIQGKHLK